MACIDPSLFTYGDPKGPVCVVDLEHVLEGSPTGDDRTLVAVRPLAA